MKKTFTISHFLKCAACALFMVSQTPANATFVPMSFAPGYSYNCDLIVDQNAIGIPTQGWMFSQGFIDSVLSDGSLGRYTLVSSLLNPASLPTAGGTFTSVNTAYNNTPYVTAPANAPNALHLRSSFDTLMFTNQTLTGDIYILGAGGDQSSPTSFIGTPGIATVTILFTSGPPQIVNNVNFPHFFDTTASNFAAEGIGVANVLAAGGNFSLPTGAVASKQPRLFDIRVQLDYTNYGRQIKGIRVAKTGGQQITVLAVTIDDNSCTPIAKFYPLPAANVNMTQANDITWSAVTGNDGYEWRLEAFPNLTTVPNPPSTLPVFPGPTATPIATLNNTNDTILDLGVVPPPTLVPDMVYVLFVRSKCINGSTSAWNRIGFKTSACSKLNPATQITVVTPPAGSGITTTSIHLKWCKSCLVTPASFNHFGFEWAITPGALSPPPANGTTLNTTVSPPPADTNINITGLLTDQDYVFHIRNKCTNANFGDWVSKPVSTLQCPTPGAPTLVAGTLSPGTATVQWPGSADPAVIGYQYALMTTPTPPTPADYLPVFDTFKVFNTLNPGQTYRFYVKSDCANVLTRNPTSLVINVPFYQCDSPATLKVTNINLHGAQIDWSRGYTPSPEPIIQYNIAVTKNRLPPPNNNVANPSNVNHNPPNNYYRLTTDTFFHPTTLNDPGGTWYYVHVRSHCDTVSMPLPVKNNWSKWKTDSFQTPTACVEPITPTINNITPTTAHMEWNLYYGILGYEYYIDELPTDPTFPTGPLITYNQVDPIGLYSGTNYWFHIRTQCDAINYSPWTNTPFTTAALCSLSAPAPALQASPNNPGATSAVFSWPTIPDAVKYDVAVTQTSADPLAPDASVSITTYAATGLTPNTSYYFHLKASCSPNDNTTWQHIPFTTGIMSAADLNNDRSVLVYPNPVSDELTVDIQNNKKGTIEVIDVTGKVIYNVETKTQKTNINMSPFSSGVYLIKYIVDAQKTQMIRVQKL